MFHPTNCVVCDGKHVVNTCGLGESPHQQYQHTQLNSPLIAAGRCRGGVDVAVVPSWHVRKSRNPVVSVVAGREAHRHER